MQIDIYAGKRILYKKNNQWHVGEVASGDAKVTEKGIIIPVLIVGNTTTQEIEVANYENVNINDVFTNIGPVDGWMKKHSEYFKTKEEYIEFIESDDFDKRLEHAFVSDGSYYYYPVSTYTRSWIKKQPFDYIVRYDM